MVRIPELALYNQVHRGELYHDQPRRYQVYESDGPGIPTYKVELFVQRAEYAMANLIVSNHDRFLQMAVKLDQKGNIIELINIRLFHSDGPDGYKVIDYLPSQENPSTAVVSNVYRMTMLEGHGIEIEPRDRSPLSVKEKSHAPEVLDKVDWLNTFVMYGQGAHPDTEAPLTASSIYTQPLMGS